MNAITGTANFVSLTAALAYYRDYGFGKPDVLAKLAGKEIAIGRPADRQVAYVQEGRYFVTDSPPQLPGHVTTVTYGISRGYNSTRQCSVDNLVDIHRPVPDWWALAAYDYALAEVPGAMRHLAKKAKAEVSFTLSWPIKEDFSARTTLPDQIAYSDDGHFSVAFAFGNETVTVYGILINGHGEVTASHGVTLD